MRGPHPAAPPIVTLTVNPCIDESTVVDQVVADRKLRCGPPRYEPGGGGINVARAVRRLGGDALAIYPAGGPAGDLLASLLEREGVAHRPLPIAGWTRENLNVLEESTGRQFRFVLPGPQLARGEWEKLLEEVEGLRPFPSFVVASGSLPPAVPTDFFARVARLTRERGGRFVLDTSGEAARVALEEGVYLVKPSLREFQHLTGLSDAEESHLVTESKRLDREGSLRDGRAVARRRRRALGDGRVERTTALAHGSGAEHRGCRGLHARGNRPAPAAGPPHGRSRPVRRRGRRGDGHESRNRALSSPGCREALRANGSGGARCLMRTHHRWPCELRDSGGGGGAAG